jgi:hypothetical protein
MSKRLEDFMKANRADFDDLEPSADLWGRIEKHLPPEGNVIPQKREARMFSLNFVLKVAASIIIVMGVAFILYVRNEKKQVDYAAINPVYAKQQVQYASMVQTKRTELRQTELATSPNQEAILQAMIRNLQIQTEVLNQQLNIIEHYNQMKKEEKNETKSI